VKNNRLESELLRENETFNCININENFQGNHPTHNLHRHGCSCAVSSLILLDVTPLTTHVTVRRCYGGSDCKI